MTAEALQRAIARYLKSEGWNVILIDAIEIIDDAEEADFTHRTHFFCGARFIGSKNLTKGGQTPDTRNMPRVSTTASKGATNRKTTKASATGGRAKTAKSKPAATGRAKKTANT